MRYVEIIANYKFQEPYLPPRCRKHRLRETAASVPIQIPCVSPDEAPLAFRHHVVIPDYTKEYRLYDGRLYARVLASSKYANAQGWWPYVELLRRVESGNRFSCLRDFPGRFLHTVEECEARMRELNAVYLLVEDGEELQVWETAGEPRYVIATFGLGNNHASTDFFIENHYNENIRKERYFNALQYDAVVEETLRVAAARGDTNSFDSIRSGDRIEVLIPSAVHCNPSVEAGEGNNFLNLLEGLTESADSVGEAAALVMAAAGAKMS